MSVTVHCYRHAVDLALADSVYPTNAKENMHVLNWAENLQVDQKVSEIKKLNNIIQGMENS